MNKAMVLLGFWAIVLIVIDMILLQVLKRSGEELAFSLHASFINILLVLCFISYVRVASTEPGFLPKPSISVDFSDLTKEISTKSSWVVCRSCSIFTPPFTKHCSLCNGCLVQSRGHWSTLRNCVGLLNYKFLLQMLFWCGVYSGYTLCVGVSFFWTAPICILSSTMSLFSLTAFSFLLLVEVQYITSMEGGWRVSILKIFGRGNRIFWIFPCSSSVSSKPDVADM